MQICKLGNPIFAWHTSLFSSPLIHWVILVPQQAQVFWEVTCCLMWSRQTRCSWCREGFSCCSLFCSVLPNVCCLMSAASHTSKTECVCVCVYRCVRASYLLSSLPDWDRLQGWRSGAALQVLKGKVSQQGCCTYSLNSHTVVSLHWCLDFFFLSSSFLNRKCTGAKYLTVDSTRLALCDFKTIFICLILGLGTVFSNWLF